MYPLEYLTSQDRKFDSRNVFGSLPCTVARKALVMSRVNQHLGNQHLAQEYAKIGLANVGQGKALIPLFQQIIDGNK